MFSFVVVIFSVLALFVLYFFRKPAFSINYEPDKIYSPAFGRVIEVEKNKIKIFLSIFDVHWQYAPCISKVVGISYTPGSYRIASNPLAENFNERNTIELENGVKITQVAGIIARRIRCFVKPGDYLKENSVIGLIAFGSQVVVEVPQDYKIVVSKGEKLAGLKSVVAVR